MEPNRIGMLMRNTYYRLCHTPSLHHLSLRGYRSLRSAWKKEKNLGASISKMTCLACLILPQCYPEHCTRCNGLEKVLTWPRSLTTSHMETWPDYVSSSYSTLISQPSLALSPITIVKALEPQKDCLEELLISGTCDNQGFEASIMESIQSFTQLEYLGYARTSSCTRKST
jgi:hypothetical protein